MEFIRGSKKTFCSICSCASRNAHSDYSKTAWKDQCSSEVSNFKKTSLHYRGTAERGSFLVSILILWTPIFLVLGMSLWLLTQGLQYGVEQRTLDRCLFPVLQRRCAIITKNSFLNHKLIQVIELILKLEMSKNIGKNVPIIGSVIYATSESTIQTLRTFARSIQKQQDQLLILSRSLEWSALQCGAFGSKHFASLKKSGLHRPFHLKSQLAKVPAPLAWEAGLEATQIHVFSLRKSYIESYGACYSDQPTLLKGEHYYVFFQDHLREKARFFSRPF